VSGNGSAFEFPCEIPVKVFGRNIDAFRQAVIDIAGIHFPDLEDSQIRERLSRGDRFLSITLTLWVDERSQIDGLYTALSAHAEILMVL